MMNHIYNTNFYSWQDDTLSKKQVETILSTKILLNDHGCAIHSIFETYDCNSWR